MTIAEVRPGELFKFGRSVWMATDGLAERPGRVLAVRIQPAAGLTMDFEPLTPVQACGPEVRRVLARPDPDGVSKREEYAGCRFVKTGRPVA